MGIGPAHRFQTCRKIAGRKARLHLTPILAVLATMTIASGFDFEGLFSGGLDHPAIEYATRPVHNAISELNVKLQEGKTSLTFAGSPERRQVSSAESAT